LGGSIPHDSLFKLCRFAPIGASASCVGVTMDKDERISMLTMDLQSIAYELETLGLQVDKLYELTEKFGCNTDALNQYIFVSRRIHQMRRDVLDWVKEET
jgi:hypothetical protein